MKFILGTKIKMTQIFDEEGAVQPVTAIKVAPAVITQVKTKDKDGYTAIQVGYGDRKSKNLSKAVKGHLKDKSFAHLKEIRTHGNDEVFEVGNTIEPSVFVVGDKVIISSISKAKGFQGVVKRHGFKGGPRSHGQKHSERAPGSIGTAGFQRVFKNKRMAGRTGGDRITVKNLKVIKVEGDQILIKGAVPGRRGTLVEIKG